jgi:hypothetical protein
MFKSMLSAAFLSFFDRHLTIRFLFRGRAAVAGEGDGGREDGRDEGAGTLI